MSAAPRRPLLIAFVVLLAVAASAPAQELPPLTRLQLGGQLAPESLGAGVVRGQRLDVDAGLLRSLSVAGDRLSITLFADTTVVGVLDRITDDRFNGYVWSGGVEGDPYGSVVLLLDEGEVIGEVRAGGHRYAIRADGPGRGLALQTAPRYEDFGDDAIVHPSGALPATAVSTESAAAAGSVIDLLGLFYPRVQSEAGGAKRIKQDFKLAVASFNLALRNAKVDLTVRLVKVKKVPYTGEVTDSSSGSTVLNHLTTSNDGQMDQAHTLRSKFGADIVTLAVDDNEAFCGLGWLNGTGAGMPASDASWAFNVVTWECLAYLTSLTVAHEAGHNMGLNHDRANSPPGYGAFPYSWGHRVPGLFRTVMAYSCQQFGGLPECPRVAHFSNPKVKYQGVATGVKESSAESANAALSHNNVRGVVEGFMPCKKQC